MVIVLLKPLCFGGYALGPMGFTFPQYSSTWGCTNGSPYTSALKPPIFLLFCSGKTQKVVRAE